MERRANARIRHYNSNSGLQSAAMMEALSIFDKVEFPDQSNRLITVVEYGSAQGNNS